MIANHFNSKGGDQPLFGRFQPPARSTEGSATSRPRSCRTSSQASSAPTSNANVVVLGDLNDFEFSETARHPRGRRALTNLIETLPQAERYTYVFEATRRCSTTSWSADALRRGAEYDSVHVNAEFADQASDHDPQVARLECSVAARLIRSPSTAPFRGWARSRAGSV